MAWNNIAKYLEKFFINSPPGKFYQKEIIKALNKIFNINLSEYDIDFRFGIVYIKNHTISGALKNEIFLNKEKIIQFLYQKIKKSGIKDIRF